MLYAFDKLICGAARWSNAQLIKCALVYTYSGKIEGERRGTAFPFRFWRGTPFP